MAVQDIRGLTGRDRLLALLETATDESANREAQRAVQELQERGVTTQRGQTFTTPEFRQQTVNNSAAQDARNVVQGMADYSRERRMEEAEPTTARRDSGLRLPTEDSTPTAHMAARRTYSAPTAERERTNQRTAGMNTELPEGRYTQIEAPERTSAKSTESRALTPEIQAEFQRRNGGSAQGPYTAPNAWQQSQIAEANRRRAEAERVRESTPSGWKDVGNAIGGTAAGFMSGVGNPLYVMARIMEMPEDLLYAITKNERFNLDRAPGLRDSVALRSSDQFAEAAQRSSDRAGWLGKQLIQAGQAAGNMLSSSALTGAAFNAMGLGAKAQLAQIAGSNNPLLTSTASRAGARLGLEVLSNPGNLGISLGSGVQSYSEALEKGANVDQALVNGLSKGLLEYLSNKIASGTPFEDAAGEKGYLTKLAEYAAESLGKSDVLKAFNQSMGGKVFNWFFDKAGEGLEEVVTGFADPWIDKITYDWNADTATIDELGEEFFGGVLLSLLMSGGEALIGRMQRDGKLQEKEVAGWLEGMGISSREARKFAKDITKAGDGLIEGAGWNGGTYNGITAQLQKNEDWAQGSQGNPEIAARAADMGSETLRRYGVIYDRAAAMGAISRGADPSGMDAAAFVNDQEAGNYFYIWSSQGAQAADAYFEQYVRAAAEGRKARLAADYRSWMAAENQAAAQAEAAPAVEEAQNIEGALALPEIWPENVETAPPAETPQRGAEGPTGNGEVLNAATIIPNNGDNHEWDSDLTEETPEGVANGTGDPAETTVVNDDPAEHTKAEQKIIEEYKNSVNEDVKEAFEKYLADPDAPFDRYKISDVTTRQAEDVSRLLGGDYSGYTNNINKNGITHILEEHGPNGTVNHSMADLNDAARIGYVLANYDKVEIALHKKSGELDYSKEFADKNNRPAHKLKFSKKVNGTYYVIEAVPESSYKKFWVVSAYIGDNNAEGITQAPDAHSPQKTPEAQLPSLPSVDSSVADDNKEVKGLSLPQDGTPSTAVAGEPAPKLKLPTVEKAKQELVKAIRMPVQGQNVDALEQGAKTGELTMDSVTIGGRVPGFTKAQQTSLAEQIIQGAQGDKSVITADVPEDGTFMIENNPSAVAQVLNRLKVKANQDSIFTPEVDRFLSSSKNVRIFTVGGEDYVSNGTVALAAGKSGAEYAAEHYKATQGSLEEIEKAILDTAGNKVVLTEQPHIFEKNRSKYYVFQTESGPVGFERKFIDMIGSGELHLGYQNYLSGKRVPLMVSVNPDGSILGFAVGFSGKIPEIPKVTDKALARGNLKGIKAAAQNGASAAGPSGSAEELLTLPTAETAEKKAAPEKISLPSMGTIEKGKPAKKTSAKNSAGTKKGGKAATGASKGKAKKNDSRDQEYSLESSTDNFNGNDMPRHPENWTAERVGDADKKPMSLPDIVNMIRHDFDIPVSTGNIRTPKARAQYLRKPQSVRSKVTNSIPDIAHELGHHLDNLYGIRQSISDAAKNEVVNAMPAEFRAQYKDQDLTGEGIAEFLRRYLQNSEVARMDYPVFSGEFFARIKPQDRASLDKLADEVNAYYSLSQETGNWPVHNREDRGRDYRNVGEKLKDLNTHFRTLFIDSMEPIKRIDEATGGKVHLFATNSAYAGNRAYAAITGDLYDLRGNPLGDGLQKALKGIHLNNKREYSDFGMYLICRHGPERLAEGMRVFADDAWDSTAWMDAKAEELAAKYPQFEEAAERLDDFQQRVLQAYGVDSGLYSQETIDAWNERWERYVPLNRWFGDKDGSAKGQKKGFANQSGPYRKAVGSGRDIINPVDNILENTVRLISTSIYNDVMQQITRAVAGKEGLGSLMEKVPMPLARKTWDGKGLKSQTLDAFDAFFNDEGKPLNDDQLDTIQEILDGAIDDLLVQFGRGKAHGDIVTVMVDGKPQYWKVNDPDLLRSVTNMGPSRASSILNYLGRVNRFITGNITGMNVVWSIASNMPRDLGTMFTFSKTKNVAKLLAGIGESYVNSFRGENAGELFKEFMAMGGNSTSAQTADKDMAKKARKALQQHASDYLNPLEWVEFVSDMIERGPRYSYYKICRTQYGMTPEEAFYAAGEITVNFKRAGLLSREVNMIIPFFNASVQGVDRAARWLAADEAPQADQKKVRTGRIAAFAGASLAIAALSMALNMRTKDKRENLEKLSNFTKNTYFVIPMKNGKYLAIPKPRELALPISLFERIMEAAIMQNPHAMDDFWEYATDNLLPGVISGVAQGDLNSAIGDLGIAGSVHYLTSNQDFLGRPIVSQALQRLEPKDQYNGSTSKLAKLIGQVFNLSPQQVDFIGNEVMGGFWSWQKALLPVSGKGDLSLGVKNKWVKDPLYSTDITNRMYDARDRLEKAKNSHPQDMNTAIQYRTVRDTASFYGNYYGLARDDEPTERNREVRTAVLDMILGVEQGKTDNEAAYRFMREALEHAGNVELMPSVMDVTVKDDEKNVYTLTSEEYFELQTRYTALYFNYIREAMDREPGMSADEKVSTVEAAKSVAGIVARGEAIQAHGGTSEKYQKVVDLSEAGIDDGELIGFLAAKDLANDDGKVTNAELLGAAAGLRLPTIEEQAALVGYANETLGLKLRSVSEYDVDAGDYRKVLDALGDANLSQANAEAAIDAAYGPTTATNQKEKAAMWQALNKGWKSDNNPYDTDVSAEVQGKLRLPVA